MTIALPFTGAAISPGPALQFSLWLALGKDPHAPQRPRVAKDARGWDCNDYAFAADQDLRRDGRSPFYVACKDELGEQHMIVAYATQDGTTYARDNRVGDDTPLDRLVAKGYMLEASSADGEVWHAFAAA